jgi:hypothetical protein
LPQLSGPEAVRTPQEWLDGHASGVASRDGEVSLLNAVIRELAAEKMATLAAMRELLSGHDNLYCAHFGAACNPADDIAAKAARRILDEA